MLLYNLVVRLYAFAIYVSSLNNEKAKSWVSGRKNWQQKLQRQIAGFSEGKRVWFHCASYGEFEQGKPLMEELKRRDPSAKIILSFFSPSGYVYFEDWKGADLVCYLPLDTKSNAREFLRIAKPQLVFFVKYEFWLNFLFEIKKLDLEAYLISATFKDHHPFFKWYGGLFRRSLKTFKIIFLQDESSLSKLKEIEITHVQVSGDTRFDRVLQIAAQNRALPGFAEFKGKSFLLVAGSTWPEDDDFLIEALQYCKGQNMKLIMAPHNLNQIKQNETITKLNNAGISVCKYSEGIQPDKQVMILDAMGLLSTAYRYGNFAYVGGGLGEGIHNTLEPAVYGIPVCFSGTGHHKYNEAVDLLNRGDAFLAANAHALGTQIIEWIEHPEKVTQIKVDLQKYFEENANVTGRIFSTIGI